MSRVIKLFQELIENNPRELEKRFLYVTFDIIKERGTEVKKLTNCGSGFLICHCPFNIAHLSLHIENDCIAVLPSKLAIRDSKFAIAFGRPPCGELPGFEIRNCKEYEGLKENL